MLNKKLSLLAGLIISGAALAQAPKILGSTAEVQGLVTVSDGTNISSVVNGIPVVEGNRFVTSSTGSVTLKLDNDCDVVLKPNQTFTAEGDRSCEVLIASIQSTSDTGGGLFAVGNASLIGLAALGTAGLLSVVAPIPAVISNQ